MVVSISANGGVNEETRRRSGGRDSRRRERLSGGARVMAACTASAKYPPPGMDEGAVGTPLHSSDTTIGTNGAPMVVSTRGLPAARVDATRDGASG